MRAGFKNSSRTRSTSRCQSLCLDREQFTTAGVWTITTRWMSSSSLMESKGARCWSFCKRTEFLIQLFGTRFRAPQLVHTYISAGRHTAIDEHEIYSSEPLYLRGLHGPINVSTEPHRDRDDRTTSLALCGARVEVRQSRVSEQA